MAAVALSALPWRSGPTVHTVLEVVATALALATGVLAVVRGQARDNPGLLYVGAGFVTAGLLDAWHGALTSAYFAPILSSSLTAVSPWSWLPSRMVVALLFLIAGWGAGRPQRPVGAATIYLFVGLVALASFLIFTVVPLPEAHREGVLHRPQDLVPGLMFLGGFVLIWKNVPQRDDPLLIGIFACLAIGAVSQLAIVPFSDQQFDARHDVAHVLKSLGYLCVFVGLVHARDEEAVAGTEPSVPTPEAGRLLIRGMIGRFLLVLGVLAAALIANDLLQGRTIASVAAVAGPETVEALEWQRRASRALLLFQMAVLGLTVLFVFWPMVQRLRVDLRALRDLAASLEVRVAERTRELARRSAELERSNRELDDFAYVASHDLRAPLRDVDNLAGWIVEDVGEGLPEDSRRHLETLQGRVRRMENLLEDLLQYSRAGRVWEDPRDVEVEELLKDVRALISPPPGFTVRWDVDDVRRLKTPRAPLHQVLRNLVDNALKHHDRPDGTIEIAVRPAGERVEFTVRDDGPGIPAAFQARVFRMFQTLRPRDEVEGSGMGLALVKKLVEAHGGEISLTSDEGSGATFRFTWPRRWAGPEGDFR